MHAYVIDSQLIHNYNTLMKKKLEQIPIDKGTEKTEENADSKPGDSPS